MKTEDIWTKYSSALQRFLRNRISNPADVEDLMQDILLKTHSSLPDLPENANIQAWLFAIARNATIDFYRRQGRYMPHADDLWYNQEEDSPPDLAGCVRPFIDGLPQQEASLLRAIDLEGLSQKAYAEMHGLPYSTVKSRVTTARRHLRHLFEGCCQLALDHRGAVMDATPRQTGCRSC